MCGAASKRFSVSCWDKGDQLHESLRRQKNSSWSYFRKHFQWQHSSWAQLNTISNSNTKCLALTVVHLALKSTHCCLLFLPHTQLWLQMWFPSSNSNGSIVNNSSTKILVDMLLCHICTQQATWTQVMCFSIIYSHIKLQTLDEPSLSYQSLHNCHVYL
jgi:hypothetical protein